MIGKVFGKVSNFVTETIGDIVEVGSDIAADVGPAVVQGTAERSLPVPVQAALIASRALYSLGPSRGRQETEERNDVMPHVEGHLGIELLPQNGRMEFENPQQAFVGGLTQAIPGIVQNIFRGLGRPGAGLATGVGGAAVGGLLMDGRNGCGCPPKAFVRFTKCGDPIITRKMKKQAIDAINCSGAEAAAATLTGGNLQLLTMIVSKQFPPMRRGISGAQMKTAQRVNRQLLRSTERLGYKCTPMPSKMK